MQTALILLGIYVVSFIFGVIVNAIYDGVIGHNLEKERIESLIISSLPVVNTIATISLGMFLIIVIAVLFLKNIFTKDNSLITRVYTYIKNKAERLKQ